MKTITVIIEYATITPSAIIDTILNNLCGLINWKQIDENFFELSILCRQENTSWVERKIAPYV